jgi:ribose 5-phosphate isomerase B
MNLAFASDHRGYKLKEELIKYYKENGYNIIDCGTNSEVSCDYPDYAYILGQKILNHEADYGIAICGSGIGISIALNKIKGIYCAKVSNKEEAMYTRCDNNTNCVAFGENTSLNNAIDIVDTFIKTEYSNLEKHNRRINKVKLIEKEEYDA